VKWAGQAGSVNVQLTDDSSVSYAYSSDGQHWEGDGMAGTSSGLNGFNVRNGKQIIIPETARYFIISTGSASHLTMCNSIKINAYSSGHQFVKNASGCYPDGPFVSIRVG
jgi:hypothetical protein